MKTVLSKNLSLAVDLLKRGELVAFPTETVYGLGASIYRPEAVQKIFAAKGRPLDNPLIVHVFSLEQALSLIENPPPDFFRLADHFWPGPLTLIVKKNIQVSPLISAGQATVAIRMPSHPIAMELLEKVGEPLAAPSANLSGRPSPTRAEDVLEDLGGRIPLILDGGPCAIGIESTVLSLISPTPKILRPGHLGEQPLEEVLQKKVDSLLAPEDPILSPGMKYRHYAPKAVVRLVFEEEELKGPFILSRKKLLGKKVHLLSAKELYHSFREADREGVEEIEVYCDLDIQSDFALMNRLLRASSEEKSH